MQRNNHLTTPTCTPNASVGKVLQNASMTPSEGHAYKKASHCSIVGRAFVAVFETMTS